MIHEAMVKRSIDFANRPDYYGHHLLGHPHKGSEFVLTVYHSVINHIITYLTASGSHYGNQFVNLDRIKLEKQNITIICKLID